MVEQLQGEDEQRVLVPLVRRVVHHYEGYYAVKSNWAAQDLLSMLSPSWTTSLEDAFLWIGGWRPSAAFQLLYSKSGIQVESRLGDLRSGRATCDLADISPSQLAHIDEFHRATLRKENEVEEKMAKKQEAVADVAMVMLSHEASHVLRRRSTSQGGGDGYGDDCRRIELELGTKEEGFGKMMDMADELRMKTIRGLVDLLTPIQAVHFLIAAAELRLRLHDWGNLRTADPDHRPPRSHHRHGRRDDGPDVYGREEDAWWSRW